MDRFLVNVGLLTGKQFAVHVGAGETIWDLKKRIEDEESIPSDAQVLIFKEKPLSNVSSIGDLGIREGSRLQLVVEMAGGPGPPFKIKKAEKADDSVVFLLCKQEEGLYMVELHLKDDGTGIKSPGQLLRIASGRPVRVVSNDGKLWAGLTSAASRPTSSVSSISTSSFLSLLATPTSSAGPSSSRYSRSMRTVTPEVMSDDTYSLDFDLTLSPHHTRPATAISVMRVPGGSKPLIMTMESRPTTALKPPTLRKSMPKLKRPNVTKSTKRTVSSGTRDLTTLENEYDDDDILNGALSRLTVGSAKCVRFSSELSKTISKQQEEDEIIDESTPIICSDTADTIPVMKFQQVSSPRDPRPLISRRQQSPKVNSRPQSMRSSGNSTLRPNSRETPQKPSTAAQTKATSKVAPMKPLKPTCFVCRKKLLSSTSFKCRCNDVFCSVHRYSDRHDCTFDWRKAGKAQLLKENPKINGTKVNQI